MKIQKTVLHETVRVAIAMLIGAALECAVYFLLKKFSLSVLFGAAYGTFFTILNFFLMGLGVQKTMEDGENAKPKRSYTLRMLMITAAVVVAVLIQQIDTIAVLIPFLLLKPCIYILTILNGKKSAKGENSDS